MPTGKTIGLLALALCPALGCGGGSSKASSPVTVDKDGDGDGFTEAQGDCNDQVAAINPAGKITVAACFWVLPEWDCPRGSDNYHEDNSQIQVSLVNNKCTALSITDATVQITVREAHGTFNYTGQTWTTEHVGFSPSSVARGNGGTIVVDSSIYCTNTRGRGTYNVYDAKVTFQTSAGSVEAVTSNARTTTFPFIGDAASGVSGLPGSRPR